jgi:hypothetical protein
VTDHGPTNEQKAGPFLELEVGEALSEPKRGLHLSTAEWSFCLAEVSQPGLQRGPPALARTPQLALGSILKIATEPYSPEAEATITRPPRSYNFAPIASPGRAPRHIARSGPRSSPPA